MVISGDKLSGRVCNRYSTTISVDGTHIQIDQLSMTMMACAAPLMATEAAYQAALAGATTVERSGDTLTLSGTDISLRYQLAQPVANAPLTGTHWVLETLVNGTTASSAVTSSATLELAPDGTATGSTGCRTFTAGYSLTGDRLTLSGLGTQTMLCTREMTPQDQQVVAVLTGGATVTVSGSTLSLTGADGLGLGYRAVPASAGATAHPGSSGAGSTGAGSSGAGASGSAPALDPHDPPLTSASPGIL